MFKLAVTACAISFAFHGDRDAALAFLMGLWAIEIFEFLTEI